MKSLFAFLLLLCCNASWAQQNRIIHSNIASLQVVAGNKWLEPPVISLNDNTPINISFDEKSHNYHRYVYTVEHCEDDWSVSKQLFKSDYIRGFSDYLNIEDIQPSINTNTEYTHYSFSIPNESCQLLMSGNYRVTVYDDNNNDSKILVAHFMVVDPKVKIGIEATTNTDLDINNRHQQLNIVLNYPPNISQNPKEEFKIVVTQNNRLDNIRKDFMPQIVTTESMIWQHNKQLIFDAGNEYHKFETLHTSQPSMGVERMVWNNNSYNAFLWPTTARFAYVYDEDANGAFYIRNSDNIENNTASDYINVHFTLAIPKQVGEIYLNGQWTNNSFTEKYRLTYNEDIKAYTAVVNLKQGYYSYQYLLKMPNGTITTLPTEGNFFQTENTYQAYVYFKGKGERTYQLVGFKQIQLK